MAFYTTYEGIGIARKSDSAYATEILPAGRSEETVIKEPWSMKKARPPGSSLDPVNIIRDMKKGMQKFVITGDLTTASAVTAETKRTNLKTLYGYNANTSTMCTFALKNVAGTWETYEGIITRLTFSRNAGEQWYELIMEVMIGTTDASS